MRSSGSRIAAVAASGALLLAACQGSESPSSPPPVDSGAAPTSEAPPERPPADDPPEAEEPREESPRPPASEPGPAAPGEPPPRPEEDRPPSAADPDGSPSDPEATPSPGPSPQDPPAEAPSPPEPEEIAGPEGPVAFGDTYVWENGLAVTVSAPRPLEAQEETQAEDRPEERAPAPDPPGPEESAPVPDSPGPEERAPVPDSPEPEERAPVPDPPGPEESVVAVDVTVVNGTDEVVHPMYLAMSSAGAEAPEHSGEGYGVPNEVLPAGEATSFQVAYSAADPARLELTVWPTYVYLPATFVRHHAAG